MSDETGLTGSYDIKLEYVLPPSMSRPSRPSNNEARAPEGPTIFQALEKQLGLKLVKAAKIPLEVRVIDHADMTPTEN